MAPTVETEVMGTQRGQMIPFLPWLVRWTRRAGTNRFCPALAALVSPVQNIIFTLLVHIAQQPGPAGVLGRLSLCLWRLEGTIRAPFSLGEWSGQGLQLGGGWGGGNLRAIEEP